MPEKFNLSKLLREIEQDEAGRPDDRNRKLSQEQIQKMLRERKQRKAEGDANGEKQ